MIISCEKCNKKFEIPKHLIPEEGRTLQCGSCSYQWHYTPSDISKNIIINDDNSQILKKKRNLPKSKNIEVNDNKLTKKKEIKTKYEKKVGFFSYLIVVLLTFIALIVVADTFKSYIPQFDFYLSSLYESLTDIFLFFKDLIK